MTDRKRLYLSETDEWIGGVCGGLADYLGMDSTVVRLLFAGSLLFGGAGIWVYIALWILLPEESEVRAQMQHKAKNDWDAWDDDSEPYFYADTLDHDDIDRARDQRRR